MSRCNGWALVTLLASTSHCSGSGSVLPRGTDDAGVRIGGSIHISVVAADCSLDRIAKIYAGSAELKSGDRTFVQVEPTPGAFSSTASVRFRARLEDVDGGVASDSWTSSTSCSEGFVACGWFTCPTPGDGGVGDDRNPEPAVYEISVTVEDDDCIDTESVSVECG